MRTSAELVKMDIDTGDSPLVSSRPYTLPLKHYEWVQREIESLECAGVITKSMSKWASPIVIIPKKSAPGEPPKRRLCVDFRKVNELQQEVITAGKTKGQISIHPLLKINEMYAKLKGAKVFSTIDLRSGYHHIALGKSSRAKTTANCFLLVFAVSGPFTSRLAVCICFSWFSRSEVCAFVWGIFVRGLRVETFVRVLRSSRCHL